MTPMRATRIATACAVATALVVLALPGAAGAKARTYKVPASTLQLLTMRASNGYKLSLTVEEHGEAFLSAQSSASRPKLQFVSYTVRRHRRTFDPGTLKLKIGDEGVFEGEFVAKKVKHEAVSAPCKGESSLVEEGFFVGRFEFHGGGGFSTAHRTRAAGSVVRSAPQVCRAPQKQRGTEGNGIFGEGEEEARELSLIAGRPDGDLQFRATRYEEPILGESVAPSISFIGGVSRTSHGVAISSDVVILSADPTAFQVPNLAEPFAEATFEPPAPFSGAATFKLANPPATRWSGGLAVELPVFGKVALTGPTVAAGLCENGTRCTKTLPKAMRPGPPGAYGGSYYVRPAP